MQQRARRRWRRSRRAGAGATAVSIVRGTFRLSIVIALLVAAYVGISGYIEAVSSDAEDMRIWTTLRCGERFLGQDMSSYTSPVRSDVIDIGKAGCSSSTFWATRDEIRKAVALIRRSVDIVGREEVLSH
jgi:hypothetical protein